MSCRHLSTLFNPIRTAGAGARRCDWWRHYRRDDGIVPGEKVFPSHCVKKAESARAIQPQLGLVPDHGPRLQRNPSGDGKSAPLARHERAHRPRNRISPARHHVSVRERTGGRGQEAWLDQAKLYQVESRLLRGAELDAVMPGASARFVAGLHTPTDGRAEPAHAAPAIAEAARDRGAKIFTNCAVRGIDLHNGRLVGVITELGRIRCDAAVLAGGAWSRLFAGNAGLDCRNEDSRIGIRTEPLPGGPDITAAGSVFAFRKRLDGGYSIARRNASTAELTPDHFRLLSDFFPRLLASRHEIGCASVVGCGKNYGPRADGRSTKRPRLRRFAYLIPNRNKGSWLKRATCFRVPSPSSPTCESPNLAAWMDVTPDASP